MKWVSHFIGQVFNWAGLPGKKMSSRYAGKQHSLSNVMVNARRLKMDYE
jgi:hypothetical protein